MRAIILGPGFEETVDDEPGADDMIVGFNERGDAVTLEQIRLLPALLKTCVRLTPLAELALARVTAQRN